VRRPVRVVGLTGGIGAGKSEALASFGRHGAAVLSSDRVVHELYERPDVKAAVAEHFGSGVIRADGSVDRGAIADRVFADADERRWLESVLLPLIVTEFVAWRDAELERGTPLLVHEAPTLFEAGVEARYDAIVTITAPEALREQRRPGASARMKHQIPEAEKAARSDFAYVNDGDLAQLDAFVESVIAQIA
jgi:dephospho-CoA kinase